VPIVVRPYRAADYAQFRWLYERTPPAGQVASAPQPWNDYLDQIADYYVAFFVAVEVEAEQESIVGSAGLEHVGETSVGPPVPDFIDVTRRTVRLQEMRTAPERQRRGIGRLLLAEAVEWARTHDYLRMILETTPQQEAAVEFYRAMGFIEQGRSMIDRWELVWFARDF
jgi:GNAT superfamily N-acetyltransferase